MNLVNARIVTDNVGRLAAFYSAVLGTKVVVNDYYVEIPTGVATLALCRRRFTEVDGCGSSAIGAERIILDFEVDNVDADHQRLGDLDAGCVMAPTDQPWGARSAMFRDPDGNLINLFTRHPSGGFRV